MKTYKYKTRGPCIYMHACSDGYKLKIDQRSSYLTHRGKKFAIPVLRAGVVRPSGRSLAIKCPSIQMQAIHHAKFHPSISVRT